jgi:hypothetical protein
MFNFTQFHLDLFWHLRMAVRWISKYKTACPGYLFQAGIYLEEDISGVNVGIKMI